MYPEASDPARVGSYSAAASAGGGYVWDEVLEYRVWFSPTRGADDLADGNEYYFAFATFAEALAASRERLDLWAVVTWCLRSTAMAEGG
jgi:hypothetical protein